MGHFVPLLAVAIVACLGYTAAGALPSQVCELRGGAEMTTFSGETLTVPVACKYHAVRRTICGKWRINVTPGAEIENVAAGPFVITTLWVGIQDKKTLEKWTGNIKWGGGQRYLKGKKGSPFTKQDGALDTEETVEMGGDADARTVYVQPKDGSFRITYGVPESRKSWDGKLSFKFECFDPIFKSTGYPKQLCGNADGGDSLPDFDEDYDQAGAQTFVDIIKNTKIDQAHRDCRGATRTLTDSKCTGKTADGKDLQTEAAARCWPLMGGAAWQAHFGNPLKTLQHCLNLVCTRHSKKDIVDPNSCIHMANNMKDLDPLPGVCEIIRDNCDKHGEYVNKCVYD